MLFISGHTFEKWFAGRGGHLPFQIPEMPGWLFWGGMAVISIGGTLVALKYKAPDKPANEQGADEIEELLSGGGDDEPPTEDDGKKA